MNFLVLLLAWLLAAPRAFAQMPPLPQVPPETLARALTLARDAAVVLAPRDARVRVEAGTLDPRLTLAPCGRAEAYLPAGMPAWGHTRVGLRCTEGRTRWNVTLPVTVQVLAGGVVLLTDLPAGARLGSAQLGRVEIDWAAAGGAGFEQTEAVIGRTLARPMTAGQALRAGDLQARQWFAQGDSVRIVVAGAGFSITGEGQALTPGVEGKPARVQTDNGRVLVGRPVSERCVEVML